MCITKEKLNELVKELKTFNGKKVELSFENSSTDTVNTYLNFISRLEESDNSDELNENKDNTYLSLFDYDSKKDETIQVLSVEASNINGYEVLGSNINLKVCDINLDDSSQISICLSDKLPSCCACGKIFENYDDTIWKISGYGGYLSRFDSERLELNLCDDCLYELLYGDFNRRNEKGLHPEKVKS